MLYTDWFAIFSNVMTAIICAAVTLLTLSQLQQDKKSWSLVRLTFMLGTLTALVVEMRVLALADQPLHDVFMPITVLTTALPYGLLTFAIDCFGAHCRWRRWIVVLQVLAMTAVTSGWFVETALHIPVIFTGVTISPDGVLLNDYPFPLLNYCLRGCGYIGLIVTVQTTISQYWKARNRNNREMLMGMSCLVFGIAIIPIPIIDTFAFEQILYTIGSSLLLVATLRYRLFDPISQQNMALKNRAERFALIQRVGQRASMRLEVKQLLQYAVDEIQQQFGYLAVTIYLSNADNQEYSRVSANADQPEVGLVEISHTMLYLATISQQQRQALSTVDAAAQSLLWLPIVVGENSTQWWIGALEIQSTHRDGFSEIDQEVLQLLAQQLAVSIRNAQLFEESQQSNIAKSDFIGYISHEVRNPLANIDNTIDFMLNYPQFYAGTALPDAFRGDAFSISSSARHLKRLLDDVLDIAKIDAGKMEILVERIDPIPILNLVLQSGLSTTASGVEVRALYGKDLPFVLADSVRLRQILLNLVSNAAKFTTKGHITLDAKVKGQFLEFVVADTGTGINADALARLFQPYAQGDRDLARKYGGTGLGLSISRRLVELQGGVIEAHSGEGEGTTIRFTIPLAENSD